MSTNFHGIPAYSGLQHHGLVFDLSGGNQAQYDLSASTSVFATPLDLVETRTIDKVEVYVTSGASTGFRCRIVEPDSSGLPSTTLAHADATATITASAGAWNTFDFTNFSLSGGRYWIVFDSPTGLTSTLRLENMPDSLYQITSGHRSVYWTGSAYATATVASGFCRVRIKSTDSWFVLPRALPSVGASGLNVVVMDTLENPACRGMRFSAPWSGQIIGFDISNGGFTANTSFDLVLATQGCASELARVEVKQAEVFAAHRTYQVRFASPITVVAGTNYDVYITAGSLATTTGGLWLVALDVADDSGAVIGSYGVPTGDVLGLSVNNPPTEGGADSPTTTGDHVYPWSPIYGTITTAGGARNFW